MNDNSQDAGTEVPMSEEIPPGDVPEEQHSIVVTEILHSEG